MCGCPYADLKAMGLARSLVSKIIKITRYRRAIGDTGPMPWIEARDLAEKADAYLPKRGTPGYAEMVAGEGFAAVATSHEGLPPSFGDDEDEADEAEGDWNF